MMIGGWSVAEIASTASALTAAAAFIMSLKNSRKITSVHVMMNSRMDEMLKMKGVSSDAEGYERRRGEEENRDPQSPQQVEIVNIPDSLKK